MGKRKFCVMFHVNCEYFGSMIVRAKDEHSAYCKAVKTLLKNNIALHSNVDMDIEEM